MQSDLTANLFAMSVDKNYCKFSRCVNTDIVAFVTQGNAKNTVLRAHASPRFVAMNKPFGPFSPKLLQILQCSFPKFFLEQGRKNTTGNVDHVSTGP